MLHQTEKGYAKRTPFSVWQNTVCNAEPFHTVRSTAWNGLRASEKAALNKPSARSRFNVPGKELRIATDPEFFQ